MLFSFSVLPHSSHPQQWPDWVSAMLPDQGLEILCKEPSWKYFRGFMGHVVYVTAARFAFIG